MDNEQEQSGGKLPRHVEQASAARTVRKTRTCPHTGEGGAAQELLAHGAGWDMMHWVNGVLGKTEGLNPSGSRVLTRIENLDVGRMRRLVDHVLFKLRATEEWICRCDQTNPSQAPRCESCYVARVKGERRVGRNASFRWDSGGVGVEEEEVNSLAPRASKLWAKLAELREIPNQDSLAVFPDGVADGSSMASILDEESPLRIHLVRFLMECDEALSMRRDGYLNPLFDHSRANSLPIALSSALMSSSTQTSPRGNSPLGDSSSLSATSSQAGSDAAAPQPKGWRRIMASSRASSYSSAPEASEATIAPSAPSTESIPPSDPGGGADFLEEQKEVLSDEEPVSEPVSEPAPAGAADEINPELTSPSPVFRGPSSLSPPAPMPALSGPVFPRPDLTHLSVGVNPEVTPLRVAGVPFQVLDEERVDEEIPEVEELFARRRSNGFRSRTASQGATPEGSVSPIGGISRRNSVASPSARIRDRSFSTADAVLRRSSHEEPSTLPTPVEGQPHTFESSRIFHSPATALGTAVKWRGLAVRAEGEGNGSELHAQGQAGFSDHGKSIPGVSDAFMDSFRGVRREWERRVNINTEMRGLSHDLSPRARRPSGSVGLGLGVGNLKAIFERKNTPVEPRRLDGRRLVDDAGHGSSESKETGSGGPARPSQIRGTSTNAPAKDAAWITRQEPIQVTYSAGSGLSHRQTKHEVATIMDGACVVLDAAHAMGTEALEQGPHETERQVVHGEVAVDEENCDFASSLMPEWVAGAANSADECTAPGMFTGARASPPIGIVGKVNIELTGTANRIEPAEAASDSSSDTAVELFQEEELFRASRFPPAGAEDCKRVARRLENDTEYPTKSLHDTEAVAATMAANTFMDRGRTYVRRLSLAPSCQDNGDDELGNGSQEETDSENDSVGDDLFASTEQPVVTSILGDAGDTILAMSDKEIATFEAEVSTAVTADLSVHKCPESGNPGSFPTVSVENVSIEFPSAGNEGTMIPAEMRRDEPSPPKDITLAAEGEGHAAARKPTGDSRFDAAQESSGDGHDPVAESLSLKEDSDRKKSSTQDEVFGFAILEPVGIDSEEGKVCPMGGIDNRVLDSSGASGNALCAKLTPIDDRDIEIKIELTPKHLPKDEVDEMLHETSPVSLDFNSEEEASAYPVVDVVAGAVCKVRVESMGDTAARLDTKTKGEAGSDVAAVVSSETNVLRYTSMGSPSGIHEEIALGSATVREQRFSPAHAPGDKGQEVDTTEPVKDIALSPTPICSDSPASSKSPASPPALMEKLGASHSPATGFPVTVLADTSFASPEEKTRQLSESSLAMPGDAVEQPRAANMVIMQVTKRSTEGLSISDDECSSQESPAGCSTLVRVTGDAPRCTRLAASETDSIPSRSSGGPAVLGVLERNETPSGMSVSSPTCTLEEDVQRVDDAPSTPLSFHAATERSLVYDSTAERGTNESASSGAEAVQLGERNKETQSSARSIITEHVSPDVLSMRASIDKRAEHDTKARDDDGDGESLSAPRSSFGDFIGVSARLDDRDASDGKSSEGEGEGVESLPRIAKRAGQRAAREGWGVMPAISPQSARSTFSPPRSSLTPRRGSSMSPGRWPEGSPKRRASLSPGPRPAISVSPLKEPLSPSSPVVHSSLSPINWGRGLSSRKRVTERRGQASTPFVCDSPKPIPWLSAGASTPEAPAGDEDDMSGDNMSPSSDDESRDSFIGDARHDDDNTDGNGKSGEERSRGQEQVVRELPELVGKAVGWAGSLHTFAACQTVNRAWRNALGGKRGQVVFRNIVRAASIPDRLRPFVWQILVTRAVAAKRGRSSFSGVGGSSTGISSASASRGGFSAGSNAVSSSASFARLVEIGQNGPHSALISRDVPRAFGAVAPHKRRERGDGSISGTAAAEARATIRELRPKRTGGGGGGVSDTEDLEEDSGDRRGAPGFGLLTSLLGFIGSDDIPEESNTPRARYPSRKSRRASLSVADFSNDMWSWLPQTASPRTSVLFGSSSPPPRGSRASRTFSLSPPRAPRTVQPPSSIGIPTAERSRRMTVGVPSSSSSGKSPRTFVPREASLVEEQLTSAQKDAAWLAEAEQLWEDVPVVAKRQCLSNVLLAVSARFPDVGYCQGMDRLLAMLMRFYFFLPEDTLVRASGKISSLGATSPPPPLPPLHGPIKPRRLDFDTRKTSLTSGNHAEGGHGRGKRDDRYCVENSEEVVAVANEQPKRVSSASTRKNDNGSTEISGKHEREGHRDEGVGSGRQGSQRRLPVVHKSSPPHASSASSTSSAPTSPERVMLGEKVFTVFAGLFEGFRLHDLYSPERGGVMVCTEVLNMLARRRLPELACHFDEIDFSVNIVAMGWFQTLFVYLHAMPRSTVRRIWDWWLSSGDFEVFFRVSMALLVLSKATLMNLDFDSTVQYFNNFPRPRVLSPDLLLPSAADVEIEEGELMYLELQVRRRESLEVDSVTQLILRPVL